MKCLIPRHHSPIPELRQDSRLASPARGHRASEAGPGGKWVTLPLPKPQPTRGWHGLEAGSRARTVLEARGIEGRRGESRGDDEERWPQLPPRPPLACPPLPALLPLSPAAFHLGASFQSHPQMHRDPFFPRIPAPPAAPEQVQGTSLPIAAPAPGSSPAPAQTPFKCDSRRFRLRPRVCPCSRRAGAGRDAGGSGRRTDPAAGGGCRRDPALLPGKRPSHRGSTRIAR